jgi:hypothetical protein
MSEIAKEIMRGRYSFSGKKWRNISKEGKNFIEGLLLKDPSKRPNTDQGEFCCIGRDCLVFMLQAAIIKYLFHFCSHILLLQQTTLALKHPWLKRATSPKRQSLHRRHSSECIGGAYGTTKMAPHLSLDIQICKSIEMFSTYSWLHRLALMVIGYKYTGKETACKLFCFYCISFTSYISLMEFQPEF